LPSLEGQCSAGAAKANMHHVGNSLSEELIMKMQGTIEFTIVERSDDRVVSEMPITAGMRNPYGVVQAGAMLWLADVTASVLLMGGQSQPTEGMKGFPLAINLSAHFLGNQSDGCYRAVSAFVKRGKSVSVVRTTVYGESNRLIADVTTNHVLSR
jgi:1,4-dihydroxy-2-naphthoyl-CoA hydrolase